MRPILMIEGLKNLHDARYCAAVGISMVTFDMDADSAGALAPAVVKEIVEWLSGLECVGKFGEEPGTIIVEKATSALVDRVMLPLGYSLETAKDLGIPLLFDATHEQSSLELAQRLQAIHAELPEALFLLGINMTAPSASAGVELPQSVLGRTILQYDDPQDIYQRMNLPEDQLFGFCLGAFARDQHGYLDYDACDAFLEAYQDQIPA